MAKCFPKGPEMRNLSINAQHIVIFENPCDKSQIRYFAQQVALGTVQNFLDVFEDCTKRSYGYLHCDFSQNTPEEIRYKQLYYLTSNLLSSTKYNEVHKNGYASYGCL